MLQSALMEDTPITPLTAIVAIQYAKHVSAPLISSVKAVTLDSTSTDLVVTTSVQQLLLLPLSQALKYA